jgi:hypothetical protein
LLAGGGLLGLVITNQGWLIINIFRNYWLCLKVEGGLFKNFTGQEIDTVVFGAVWPSAWRSGLGVFMGYGVVHYLCPIRNGFGSSFVSTCTTTNANDKPIFSSTFLQ